MTSVEILIAQLIQTADAQERRGNYEVANACRRHAAGYQAAVDRRKAAGTYRDTGRDAQGFTIRTEAD